MIKFKYKIEIIIEFKGFLKLYLKNKIYTLSQ